MCIRDSFRGADLKEVTKLFEAMGYGIAHSSAKDICCINKNNHLLVEMQTHLIDEGYTLSVSYTHLESHSKYK